MPHTTNLPRNHSRILQRSQYALDKIRVDVLAPADEGGIIIVGDIDHPPQAAVVEIFLDQPPGHEAAHLLFDQPAGGFMAEIEHQSGGGFGVELARRVLPAHDLPWARSPISDDRRSGPACRRLRL